MLVHRRVTPSINFACTHLYTWVKRGTVRVKCLAQEHSTMSPARARKGTARSGVERTNQKATVPPKKITKSNDKNIIKFSSFILYCFHLTSTRRSSFVPSKAILSIQLQFTSRGKACLRPAIKNSYWAIV